MAISNEQKSMNLAGKVPRIKGWNDPPSEKIVQSAKIVWIEMAHPSIVKWKMFKIPINGWF